MIETTSAAPSPAAQAKTRNPVERLLVWGLILGLAVVTALEGRTRLAYSQSLAHIQDALTKAENQDLSTFQIDQVPALLVGNPTETHESRSYDQIAHYQWKGLFKQYGLHVSYGTHTKVVTGVTTDDPPAEQPLPQAVRPEGSAVAEQAESQPAADQAASGGPGGPGGGGGGDRPRFDPMQADTDGDGKLSRNEVPERMAAVFDTIDTNGDGFLDAEELANRPRPQFGGGGGPGGGGRPGGGGGSRSRPEADTPAAPASEAPSSDAPAATPAAENPEATPADETPNP